MQVFHNVSTQKVSWVKSNREALEANNAAISNLFYPESTEELIELIRELTANEETFELIGHSSNTLFLPSYHIKNLICTKFISSWSETETEIICECGVSISKLSSAMIKKGYAGFEGLTDLPGTVAGAVYGNSGCRKCSVNSLVIDIELLTKGEIRHIGVEALKMSYRSTALKRKEIDGTILRVRLRKIKGDPKELTEIANYNHLYRRSNQPSGANNLGTTFNGGRRLTLKGRLLFLLERFIQVITFNRDSRHSYALLLKIIGKGYFTPYIYRWNRYMFMDAKAHVLFPSYIKFIQTIFKDVRLEIEIRN